jgi:hypothetical protein
VSEVRDGLTERFIDEDLTRRIVHMVVSPDDMGNA